MKNYDELLEQIASGRNPDQVLEESIGALIPAPDQTAVNVNIQKPVASSTSSPKGGLSMPVDIGTYPIDPQDAVKILFFKVATQLEPFMASLIAFYPEGEEMQYKVQDFVVKTAERISKQIDILGLGDYSDLGWIALAYLAEQDRMPILKNVLYGEYAGEYWMVAYGQCVYQDEDGISSARFESDYRVFRSMINDYDTEDLVTYANVGVGTATEEAELEPEVDITGANDQGLGEGKDEEDEEDVFSVPGAYGEPMAKSLTKIATLSKGDMEEDSVLDNDAIIALGTDSGLTVDQAKELIARASSGKAKPEFQEGEPEDEEGNPKYSEFTAEDVKRRLVRLESASMVSAVINRDEIKELRKELKVRKFREDTGRDTMGIQFEIDPNFDSKKDVNPDEDKPFKDSGAATTPEKAATSVPSTLGTAIDKAIDNIDNAETDVDDELESILFNISGAHPGDESGEGSEDKDRYNAN